MLPKTLCPIDGAFHVLVLSQRFEMAILHAQNQVVHLRTNKKKGWKIFAGKISRRKSSHDLLIVNCLLNINRQIASSDVKRQDGERLRKKTEPRVFIKFTYIYWL